MASVEKSPQQDMCSFPKLRMPTIRDSRIYDVVDDHAAWEPMLSRLLLVLYKLYLLSRLSPRITGSSAEAGNAHASWVACLLVCKTMNYTVIRVEFTGYAVEVLCVASLISSENSVGDVVGELNDARCPRVHK